jgi:hypothetical protein
MNESAEVSVWRPGSIVEARVEVMLKYAQFADYLSVFLLARSSSDLKFLLQHYSSVGRFGRVSQCGC